MTELTEKIAALLLGSVNAPEQEIYRVAREIAALSAAKSEPVAVGEAGTMPGTDGFTIVTFKASDVPVGTTLYALASEPANVSPLDAKAKEVAGHLNVASAIIANDDYTPPMTTSRGRRVFVTETIIEAADLITAQAERIAELERGMETAITKAIDGSRDIAKEAIDDLSKKLCDRFAIVVRTVEARAEAAEAEVRTLREALERAADELDMAENIVGYDLSEAKADVVRALARAKEP